MAYHPEEEKLWQLQAKIFQVEDRVQSSLLRLHLVPPLHDLHCITYTSYIQRLSLQY